MKNKRIAGLDIIRSIAIFFVISIHFLFNTNFYHMPIHGKGMIILTGCRHLLATCVPLFMVLTGYLNSHKELNKDYYKGLLKTLKSYIFIAIICVIFREFYFNEHHSFLYWLEAIFNFTANDYSWYIEMFIGLYLLIPFLNILYKNLNTKLNKKYLIGTLILITSIPSITNTLIIMSKPVNVLPDWWTSIYPLTYYFIGAYIKEYQPKLKLSKNIVYMIIILLVHTTVYYLLYEGRTYYKHHLVQYYNILNLMLTTLIFLLFYQKDIKNQVLKKLISLISICSLDMYLFSYLIDKKVYQYIKPLTTNPKEHIAFMIPTIIFIFTIAFIISYLKKLIFDLIEQKNKKTNQYIK